MSKPIYPDIFVNRDNNVKNSVIKHNSDNVRQKQVENNVNELDDITKQNKRDVSQSQLRMTKYYWKYPQKT